MASHCDWDVFLIFNQALKPVFVSLLPLFLSLQLLSPYGLWPLLEFVKLSLATSLHIPSVWQAVLPHLPMTGSFSSFRSHLKCEESVATQIPHPWLFRLFFSHCHVDFFPTHLMFIILLTSIYFLIFYLSSKISFMKPGPSPALLVHCWITGTPNLVLHNTLTWRRVAE